MQGGGIRNGVRRRGGEADDEEDEGGAKTERMNGEDDEGRRQLVNYLQDKRLGRTDASSSIASIWQKLG